MPLFRVSACALKLQEPGFGLRLLPLQMIIDLNIVAQNLKVSAAVLPTRPQLQDDVVLRFR
jgi:hypothetical protein